jgi:hypothetical protein
MALLGVLLSVHGMLFWHGLALAREGYSDFTIFYTAGKMIRLGQGHHLYDNSIQYQMQQSFASGVRIRKGPLPYNHPAFEALLFAPLTRLDYAAAYVVWDLINLGILAVIPFLLRPHIALLQGGSPLFWLLILLAFFPAVATLMQGQDVILLLLFYALAFVALKKNAEMLAGFWLGLGMFRFQLVIPWIVIFLCWKRWKMIQSFLITTAVVAAVSVAVTGWAEALRYPRYVLQLEANLGRGGVFPAVMPNLRGLLAGWPWARNFPITSFAIVLVSSFCVLLWVTAEGRGRQTFYREFDLKFSLATIATVLLCYHAYAYDLSILVIPVLLVVSYLRGKQSPHWRDGVFLLLPVVVLFFTPLYIWLGFRSYHLNLIAAVELLWLWGVRREIASAAQEAA